TAPDAQQQITLNFNFIGSGINSLLRLNRTTGAVDTVALSNDGSGHYHLNLTLDGGTGDLFKFNDGAPFVGIQSPGTMYWDNDASAGNNNASTGAGTGGTGNWDTSSSKWYNGS